MTHKIPALKAAEKRIEELEFGPRRGVVYSSKADAAILVYRTAGGGISVVVEGPA